MSTDPKPGAQGPDKTGPQEGDPVSDWRVINKKAESDQELWVDDMRHARPRAS